MVRHHCQLFGQMTKDQVTKWVQDLTVSGVGGATACLFDEENLWWLGKAIMALITLPMWNIIEKEVGAEPLGPLTLFSIVQQYQITTASLVQELMEELKKFDLKKEPGQNVRTMAGKITEFPLQHCKI